MNRIKQFPDGWYFHDGSDWVGPYDDEDEAIACMGSNDYDDWQAEWERQNPHEL